MSDIAFHSILHSRTLVEYQIVAFGVKSLLVGIIGRTTDLFSFRVQIHMNESSPSALFIVKAV